MLRSSITFYYDIPTYSVITYNVLTAGAVSLLLRPPEQCWRLVWALRSTAQAAGAVEAAGAVISYTRLGSSLSLYQCLGNASVSNVFTMSQSRFDQTLNVLACLMSWHLCLGKCLCLRKKCLDSITGLCSLAQREAGCFGWAWRGSRFPTHY